LNKHKKESLLTQIVQTFNNSKEKIKITGLKLRQVTYSVQEDESKIVGSLIIKCQQTGCAQIFYHPKVLTDCLKNNKVKLCNKGLEISFPKLKNKAGKELVYEHIVTLNFII